MKACRLRALESFRGTLRRGVSNNGLSLSVSADESSHRQPAFRRHMYLSCFAPRAAALACINIRLRQSDGLCIRACNCLPDTCQPADVQHPHLHLACQPLLHPFITLSGLSRHCLPPLLSFPCFLSSLLGPPPSPRRSMVACQGKLFVMWQPISSPEINAGRRREGRGRKGSRSELERISEV